MGMAKAKIQPYTRTRSPWRVSERRSAVAVLRTGILPALLVLVMSICVSTSADARRWKWWHYYSSYERSARSGDDDHRRARSSKVPGLAASAGRGVGALGAIAERLISGCRQQSAELANLPFDTIARIAAPDDAQHAALDALRGTAREAAERFASDCPQSVPAGPAVRLRMNFRFSRALPPGGLAHARPDDLEAFPSGLGHAASGTTYLPR